MIVSKIVCLPIAVVASAAGRKYNGRIPDPKIAEKKVTAIGMKGSDGFDQIFVLKTEGTEQGTNELDQNIKVTFYDLDKEKEMIHDAFKIIKEFPFVVTYNGDEFDLPYLYNRGERLESKILKTHFT